VNEFLEDLFEGRHTISVQWWDASFEANPSTTAGYVDNITVEFVPEPSSTIGWLSTMSIIGGHALRRLTRRCS
jgi:hypothetical protein